ncbi:hypothetical protein DRW07_10235 [Alteromonas sediminis]|uniref:Acyltransferase 3 domain-containing protein n=1 Tax=Alteromonas sediminis TaxID=2259342 RepID=A0A3N5Z720_9ALTE|nr:acyltransferase family protein [Alteromonas sediminis]RPJ66464.1 hypothetical protein DRW07_10235 [Alteromonas sediminis]
MTNSTSPKRIDYLDASRAFALILGIVFHASLSFIPVFIGWAVMDVSTSWITAIFATISHSFRLELFFLIAGFFSHMTFHRDGSKRFLKSRVIRIAIPLIIGWFILRPLIVSGFTMGGQSLRGEIDITSSLMAGLTDLQSFPTGFLVGTHLWFLYYLLLITAVTLVCRAILRTSKKVSDKLTGATDTAISWLLQSPFALAAMALPIACCLWFMDSWGMDTPDKSLSPHWPVLLIYGGFFVLGWMLHRQPVLLDKWACLSWKKLVVALVSVISSVVLMDFQMQVAHPHYDFIKAGFVVCYAVMMMALVLLTLGLFQRVLNQPNKIVRYLADASYWMYLIHLPVVIFLQVVVAEWSFHWSVKWLGITITTVILSLFIYDLLVRNTFIGATLNGRRKPRAMIN